MDLLLIRHAHAGPGSPDEARQLSAIGRQSFTQLVRRLDQLPQQIGRIASSPLVRAQQTAQLLCELRGWRPPVSWPELTPESGVDAVLARLQASRSDGVALVTHQPLVGRLMARLTHDEHGFPPGTIAALQYEPGGNSGLRWIASP